MFNITEGKRVVKMTKIDIYSGFLGAGKTTLIKKLLAEAYKGMQVVLIENEFGEIGVDGGFLKDAGVEIKELNAGCICCSLTGDFKEALKLYEDRYPVMVTFINQINPRSYAAHTRKAHMTEIGKFDFNDNHYWMMAIRTK